MVKSTYILSTLDSTCGSDCINYVSVVVASLPRGEVRVLPHHLWECDYIEYVIVVVV